ncbi:FHA domain-containing protein [Parabacteroides pacaensis]|uniref:FHA domain-containing protein n=1 Tax=Parabacteroides pacaensis TaxID=2086575 RepID=UPI000D107E80|nr:FHA domain-containing protein [Parabacteroides pacaensis]
MKKIYTIGRDENCDIVIPDNTDVISRLHATLRIESNAKIFLIDQSRNGTYINGMKMSSNVEIPISRKDVISFAHICNLDWSLIPKQKNSVFKSVLIMLFSLLVLVGVAYTIKNYSYKEKLPEPIDPKPMEPTLTIKPDTVVVRDTIVVESKEKPKAKEASKDTVKVERNGEEIYNPIY